MKRLIALLVLGIGTAALAQTSPPAAAPVAKKMVVHKRVMTHIRTRTVTHHPSPNGVAHTNIAVKKTVMTPTSVHTRTVTKTSTTTPSH